MIYDIDGAQINGQWGSEGPDFAQPVCDNGYIWWYLDALSEDGTEGITLIALLGNYCSPYYAAARRRSEGVAENYCAINAILYRPKGSSWAMTERGSNSVSRSADKLSIGPTNITWKGRYIVIDLDEITVPIPSRLQGQITVELPALCQSVFAIDGKGNHLWWPAGSSSKIAVDLKRPNLSWKGTAYFDSNRGIEPLENCFRYWDWYRAPTSLGETIITYNTHPLNDELGSLAIRIGEHGFVEKIQDLASYELPKTPIWRMRRETRADAQSVSKVIRTFEDTPFYSRSLIANNIGGKQLAGFHESIDFERFRKRWVQFLLPFRMPRRTAKLPK